MWRHYNTWVDGTGLIAVFPTREEAVASLKQFVCYLNSTESQGNSDDGDFSWIDEVPEHFGDWTLYEPNGHVDYCGHGRILENLTFEQAVEVRNTARINDNVPNLRLLPYPDDSREDEQDYNDDDGWSDVEADADTLKSAGYGTDEDYNPSYHDNDE